MNSNRKLYRALVLTATGAMCLQAGCMSGIVAQIVLPLVLQLGSELLMILLNSAVGTTTTTTTSA